MKYGELPERPPLGVFLYCEECNEKYSATRGDYFLAGTDTEITCRAPCLPDPDTYECGALLILATEQRTIVPL
jgi:hypothetical protein